MQGNPIATLRRPEYTGENRCLPCTVTNLAIAAALSGGLLWLGAWLDAPAAGAAVGGGLFLLSLASIYLRGYLVPGTPTLTRRYFPAWLLGLFGKAPGTPVDEVDLGSGAETALVEAGVLDDASGEGASLSAAFRTDWSRAVEPAGSVEDPADALAAAGDVDTMAWNDVYRVYVDDEIVGKWRSEAAFVADLASASALSDWLEGWEDLAPAERTRLLDAVRRSVDTCPDCGGAVEPGIETVRGCCATFEAKIVSCQDCEAPLYTPACPDCGNGVEYVTEPVGADDPEEVEEPDEVDVDAAVEGPAVMGTAACADCGERVTSVPAFLSPPR